MQRLLTCISAVALTLLPELPASAATVYFNDTPLNTMGMASRPGVGGKNEIEAADDFLLSFGSRITGGTFTGLLTGNGPTIGLVNIEIYRVFPNDSTNPPSGRVPTRTNSPSDIVFGSRGTLTSDLSFSTTTLSASFTATNSVLNGINALPNQTTGGEGPITGQEVRFNFAFLTPMDLPADHYFFIPQVQVAGGEFYWLSASRPISGAGTTPFSPDLQAWIRNASLDPDWLRVGSDIVGGAPAPTFNAAFSLNGSVPEPSSIALVAAGIAFLGVRRLRSRR